MHDNFSRATAGLITSSTIKKINFFAGLCQEKVHKMAHYDEVFEFFLNRKAV